MERDSGVMDNEMANEMAKEDPNFEQIEGHLRRGYRDQVRELSDDHLRGVVSAGQEEIAARSAKSVEDLGRQLHELRLVLADHLGLSTGQLFRRGRELEYRRNEQFRAEARAAVERGEISRESDYMPF